MLLNNKKFNLKKFEKFLEIYKQASLSLSKIFQYVYHEYIKSSKKSSRLTSIVEMMINNNLIYSDLNLETYYSLDINIMIKHNLSLLFEKKSKELEKLNNIDDEFLDPITFEVIKNPVILPNTNIIVDKVVIEQILRNNSINPFTGIPLTIEELEKYNKLDYIVDKINIFVDKLNKVIKINSD
jgi:ubiquitin conjugation factor E4 B